MTFDFHLGHSCPHLTVEEEVPLSADRRSLVTRQPVASAGRMRVTANDVDIPQGGLYSQASITGSFSGPFRIPPYARDLAVKNRTHQVVVTLPTGTRILPKDVIQILDTEIRRTKAPITVYDQNGVLVFGDTADRGPQSTISVGGLAKDSIGFAGQSRGRGKMIYPGWNFAETEVLNPRANTAQPRIIVARYPKFVRPVIPNPVFKVIYTTYQAFCLRCLGYGIENDFRIDVSGDYRIVTNEDKLNQDSIKIITTQRGSNPYFPEYGSTLLSRIGIKAIGAGVATISEDVSRSMTFLQRIQQVQRRYQELSLKETLQSIVSINVMPSSTDPTAFEVRVVATNASTDPVQIRTVFSVPQAAALAGTNGLSLGLAERGINPALRSIANF